MEKYFDNLTLGQFLLTGIKPIKVYVDGRYLILTDTDDIEDPLYGQGMTINGQMVHFDYRVIDHILVGDKPVTLDMLGAEEEGEEGAEEEGAEEEGAEEEGEEEEVEEEGHIRLGSLIEIGDYQKQIEKLEKEKLNIIKKTIKDAEAGDSEAMAALTAFGTPTEAIEEDSDEFELDYCDKCMQMKNHKDGECQKCKKENKGLDEDCGCGGEAGEPGIDTISEPYMYKIGDMVQDINPSCKHFGSKGIVLRIYNDDLADTLVKYMVTNNGGSYEQGDILDKTADQLEPM
jgi:hypothetical protein